MKSIIIIVLFLFSFSFINAQEKENSNLEKANQNNQKIKKSDEEVAKEETKRLVRLLNKLEGTYQIQIINSRKDIDYNLSLMDVIIAKRHLTDVIYYKLKDNVRVMILPFSEINKINFIRLERIKHIIE